jgi:hypothetical protein
MTERLSAPRDENHRCGSLFLFRCAKGNQPLLCSIRIGIDFSGGREIKRQVKRGVAGAPAPAEYEKDNLYKW